MDYVWYGVAGRNWSWWCHAGVIVDWFRFMRRNHPCFGAQVAGGRNHRNAAGTVMSPVATRPVAAAGTVVVVVVRLLRLAHVLGRHSGATGDDTVDTVVRLPAATMLLMGQRYHVGWSKCLLMVLSGAAGRDTRMMVLSVVVNPGSLGWHIRRWHARQMR